MSGSAAAANAQAAYEKRKAEREAERLAKVTRIPSDQYDGPVCADPYGELYFSDWGEYVEWFEDQEKEGPLQAYACHLVPLHLDADDILTNRFEQELDNGLPDGYDEGDAFDHVEELKEFLAAWNAKQTFTYWMVDDTRLIVPAGGGRG